MQKNNSDHSRDLARKRDARYREKHREQLRQRAAEYRERNRDMIRERERAWIAEHPSEHSKRVRRYTHKRKQIDAAAQSAGLHPSMVTVDDLGEWIIVKADGRKIAPFAPFNE